MNDVDGGPGWADRFGEETRQIANMDECDYLTLLIESRILPAP